MKKPLVEFPIPGAVSGIYFLLRKGEVVYVGQSTNVLARLASHYNNMVRMKRGLSLQTSSKGIIFDGVRFFWCAKADLAKEELRFIQLLKPKENSLMKREPGPDLSTLPFFQELCKKADVAKEREIKRRKLPHGARLAEQDFRQRRDSRQHITLPKLSFQNA